MCIRDSKLIGKEVVGADVEHADTIGRPFRYEGSFDPEANARWSGQGCLVVFSEERKQGKTGYIEPNPAPFCDGDREPHEVEGAILTYKGQWKNGWRHGKGVEHHIQHLTETGSDPSWKYSGSWEEDLFDGHGVFENEDYAYDGHYVRGYRHGTGEMQYSDPICNPEKLRYTGEWKDDELCGKGKLTLRCGAVHEGDFMHNECHGQGKRTYPHGTVYLGHFHEGAKVDDCAREQRANGDVLVGPFVLNRGRHGWFQETTASDGCITKVRYRNDIRQRVSKRTAVANAQAELDDLMDSMNSNAYVKLSRRIQGTWKAIHDPHAKLQSDEESNNDTDPEREDMSDGE